MDHWYLQRFGDLSIACFGGVATLNIQRLVYRPPDVARNSITSPPCHSTERWDDRDIIEITKGLGDRFEEMLDQ